MAAFYTGGRGHALSHEPGLPKEVRGCVEPQHQLPMPFFTSFRHVQVAAILPSDPEAQLALAVRIMSHAYAQRVAELEAEAATLQEGLNQKHMAMKSMERRLASFEAEVQELQQQVGSTTLEASGARTAGAPAQQRPRRCPHARRTRRSAAAPARRQQRAAPLTPPTPHCLHHAPQHRQSLEQQQQHEAEKAALVETIKRLNRDVVRLESFKRNLMQTLHDDEVRRPPPRARRASQAWPRPRGCRGWRSLLGPRCAQATCDSPCPGLA
jgi:hypothetical protein